VHASMKFGCELETSVGWEGRTVQPAGLQAVVDEVREAFSAGTMVLSADDTSDVHGDTTDGQLAEQGEGQEEEEEEEHAGEVEDGDGSTSWRGATVLPEEGVSPAPSSPREASSTMSPTSSPCLASSPLSSSRSPHEQWLRAHRLHHGMAEFFEVCRREGHSVMVLGGPGRSGALCREVLAHLGIATRRGNEDWEEGEGEGGEGEEGTNTRSHTIRRQSAEAEEEGEVAVRMVGAEHGSARGLAVAAMMVESEMPWQRWHLVDSSVAELTRITASNLPETAAFSAHYAGWIPARHSIRVKAEVEQGVDFIDHAGMFELVGVAPPDSVMDSLSLVGRDP